MFNNPIIVVINSIVINADIVIWYLLSFLIYKYTNASEEDIKQIKYVVLLQTMPEQGVKILVVLIIK